MRKSWWKSWPTKRKKIHKNLKVVEVDGKKVEFNPEEDPRLVKAIMEAEKEESIELMPIKESN
ncbi:MAG: hypothetical protein PQ971_05650 [Methanobacterium sp.]|jgi:hypothetical protein